MSLSQKLSKARSLQRKGEIETAIGIYLSLLSRFPKNTKIKNELVKISKENQQRNTNPSPQTLRSVTSKHKIGQIRQALEDVRTLKNSFPNSSITANIYGTICAEMGFHSEAEKALKRSLLLEPANANICNNLGNVYREQNDLEQAISFYQLAVVFEPSFATAHINLGIVLSEKKMFDAARICFKKAIQSNPSSGPAYRYLSMITDFGTEAPIAEDISNLLQSAEIGDFDRSELHFAFAKACEDVDNFDGAFESLSAGGKLKQKIFGYRRLQDEENFVNSARLLAKLDAVSSIDQEEYCGPMPIFILGMPRSGTSLVEQILSAHSKVQPAGELPTAELLCQRIFDPNSQPTANDIQKFRASYLAKILQISNGKPFVTDKMPQNFLHIGLIRKAIPESKIILVKRDAKATCWSNFRHCFQSKQMAFSFDLDDTVAYYLQYLEFMKAIENRYNNYIFTLDYDLLSEDPATEISSLLSYLAIPKEDGCFSPHENKYVARTASQLQVQKPIYRGSSSIWKRFEKHVQSSFSLLDQAT